MFLSCFFILFWKKKFPICWPLVLHWNYVFKYKYKHTCYGEAIGLIHILLMSYFSFLLDRYHSLSIHWCTFLLIQNIVNKNLSCSACGQHMHKEYHLPFSKLLLRRSVGQKFHSSAKKIIWILMVFLSHILCFTSDHLSVRTWCVNSFSPWNSCFWLYYWLS